MTKLTLDNDKQVFFYEQDFYVLSNFSSFSINFYSYDFPTAEHLYHYLKFDYNTSKDNDLKNKCTKIKNSISTAKSAHEAFKIAQECKEFRDPDWDNIKFEKMLQVLRLKVEQHEYVKKKLLETGDRELIENSWRDDVWGWGENRDGQNALGKLWMTVRSEVKLLEDLKNPPLPSSEHEVSLLDLAFLREGDEFRKKIIKNSTVLRDYKILLVQEIYQKEDKKFILFRQFSEDADNVFLSYHELIFDPENIKKFLQNFTEEDSEIRIFRG